MTSLLCWPFFFLLIFGDRLNLGECLPDCLGFFLGLRPCLLDAFSRLSLRYLHPQTTHARFLHRVHVHRVLDLKLDFELVRVVAGLLGLFGRRRRCFVQQLSESKFLLFKERDAKVLEVLVVEPVEVLDSGLYGNFEELDGLDGVGMVLFRQLRECFCQESLLKNFSMTLSISWMMNGSMFSLSGIQ